MIKRRSNWYIYVITFIVTGLLIAVVSTMLLNSFYEAQRSGNTGNVSQQQGTLFVPDKSYNFTILLSLSENIDTAPERFMTLTYRADKNTVVLMPYLANTEINGKTLKTIFSESGGEETAKQLSAASGITIDKYIAFTESTVTEFFNMVGNTTLTIPKQLKYEDKEDNTVTLIEAGTRSFTGTQLYTYLMFPDYGSSDIQYSCKIAATSVSAFINQNFLRASEKTLKSYADFIIGFTDTNITEDDYNKKIAGIVYTLGEATSLADYYIPYGENSGKNYIIVDNSWTRAKEVAEAN